MKTEIWSEIAEKSLLGSMILSSSVAYDIHGKLNPQDFFRPAHANIYQAITHLFNTGKALDIVTLRDCMSSAKTLQDSGGIEYLLEIAEFVPSAANAESYAKIVKDKAILRRLSGFASNVDSMIHDDGLDPADKLEKAEAMLAEVASYSTPEDSKVADMSSVLLELCDYVDKAKEAALKGETNRQIIPSKFHAVNECIQGYECGCVYVVGARSSMGKTSLIETEALNMAFNGVPVLPVTREMTPLKIVMRMVSKLSKVPLHIAKQGRMTEQQEQDWTQAADYIYSLPWRFIASPDAKVQEIKREAKAFAKVHGRMPVIFDDYIQMALNGSRNMHMELAAMMKAYKTLAIELNTPVIICSQISRGVESREDKRPGLSDLKESGSLEENADTVLLLYRKEYYDARKEGRKELGQSPAEIIIAKAREGSLGTATVKFRPAFTEFSN